MATTYKMVDIVLNWMYSDGTLNIENLKRTQTNWSKAGHFYIDPYNVKFLFCIQKVKWERNDEGKKHGERYGFACAVHGTW